jgi:hypothetical protein
MIAHAGQRFEPTGEGAKEENGMQGAILWMLISIAASIQMTLKIRCRLIPVKVRSRRA